MKKTLIASIVLGLAATQARGQTIIRYVDDDAEPAQRCGGK
jgi:hypothetical protein